MADLAYEVVAHRIGFLIAGGRSCILTTTRLIETQRLGDRGGYIFDLGPYLWLWRILFVAAGIVLY